MNTSDKKIFTVIATYGGVGQQVAGMANRFPAVMDSTRATAKALIAAWEKSDEADVELITAASEMGVSLKELEKPEVFAKHGLKVGELVDANIVRKQLFKERDSLLRQIQTEAFHALADDEALADVGRYISQVASTLEEEARQMRDLQNELESVIRLVQQVPEVREKLRAALHGNSFTHNGNRVEPEEMARKGLNIGKRLSGNE